MQAIPIQCRSRLKNTQNHSNNGLAILHGLLPRRYTELQFPFQFRCISVLQYIIMQVTATKSIHIIIQELMNLLHRNSFLPGRISSLTLSVLMSSVLTNYVSAHVCISVQVLVQAHAVEQ